MRSTNKDLAQATSIISPKGSKKKKKDLSGYAT